MYLGKFTAADGTTPAEAKASTHEVQFIFGLLRSGLE